MKHFRIFILRLRALLVEADIKRHYRESMRLELKEIRIEKKLKALGYTKIYEEVL